MSVQRRRKYDPEFKKNAVLLTEEPDRSVRDVAEKLGIQPELIYRCHRPLIVPGDLGSNYKTHGSEL